MKGGNESNDHYRLKKASLVWLHNRGARTIAFEVPVRTTDFTHLRIDVAAWDHHTRIERSRGPRGGRRRRRLGQVDEFIAIECKAARADFLKDSRAEERLAAELADLDAQRDTLEALIRKQEPELRYRKDLFSDEIVWKYDRSANEDYARLRRSIRRLARQLHGGTKFDRLRQSAMFHRHYVCATPDVARPAELPPDWGLLVMDPDTEQCRIAREAALIEADPYYRGDLVQRLARVGTRALVELIGLQRGETGLEPVATDDGEDGVEDTDAGDQPADIEEEPDHEPLEHTPA